MRAMNQHQLSSRRSAIKCSVLYKPDDKPGECTSLYLQYWHKSRHQVTSRWDLSGRSPLPNCTRTLWGQSYLWYPGCKILLVWILKNTMKQYESDIGHTLSTETWQSGTKSGSAVMESILVDEVDFTSQHLLFSTTSIKFFPLYKHTIKV